MNQNKRISRRDFLRLASVTTASVVLTSCAKAATETEIVDSSTPVEQPANAPPKEDVEVTVLIYGNMLSEGDDTGFVGLFTDHLMKYNEQGKGVKVKYEPYPGGDDYNSKIRLLTASGELEDVLVWGNWQAVPNLVLDNILLPLDSYMSASGVSADEWIQSAMKLLTFDPDTKTPGAGKVYGIPYIPNSGADFLFINVDMVSGAGFDIPTEKSTLFDLEKIATAIAKPEEGVFGLSSNLWGTTHGIAWDQAYTGPFGGRVLDESGTKCLINSPECVEAYEWEHEIRHVKHIAGNPDEVTAYGGYREGAMNSKLAMYRMGAWGGQWFLMREENKGPEMTYALYPSSYDGRSNGRRGNSMSADYYGISSNAKHPEECFGVLYWLTGYDAGVYMLESAQGQVVPRKDILEAPILDKYPWAKAVASSVATAELQQTSANLRDREINELITQRFQTVDTGETMPDQAFLDDLAGEIQAILDMPKL